MIDFSSFTDYCSKQGLNFVKIRNDNGESAVFCFMEDENDTHQVEVQVAFAADNTVVIAATSSLELKDACFALRVFNRYNATVPLSNLLLEDGRAVQLTGMPCWMLYTDEDIMEAALFATGLCRRAAKEAML